MRYDLNRSSSAAADEEEEGAAQQRSPRQTGSRRRGRTLRRVRRADLFIDNREYPGILAECPHRQHDSQWIVP
jgi:hypothetical protein